MADYTHVFSPFRIGNVEVKNRIEIPPMLPCLATMDGFVTREMIDFYQAFARGGAGVVTIGDTAIDFEYARGHFGQLNLGDDRVIGGLSSLAEAVQKYGAKISIELNHPGRLSPPLVLDGRHPIGPSPIPTRAQVAAAQMEGRPTPQIIEMDQKMIDQVIDNYVTSCLRCIKAGFEMVMIHGGHGHLLGQFVSPYSNKRTDQYGGALENRARFVIEILTAIRNKVGKNLAIEYRVSADELVPGGMDAEETILFLRMIADKIDLINVSLATIAEPEYIPFMSQPNYLPHAYNAERAARIKKEVGIPVTCVGSVTDLELAERVIAEGKADMVAMGRAHIADPALVNKTLYRSRDEVRPCLRCNTCGEKAPDFLPVRCAVNPVIGREGEYTHLYPAKNKKKIVVIGGGPAGMQTTITASSRGHDVVLFEKEQTLGGALKPASHPSFKNDMKRYLDWIVRTTERAPANIRVSTEATLSIVEAEKPDALIIAVGAEPFIPDIPGTKRTNVFWAGDVHGMAEAAGKKVVVAGAGLTGCECALDLAQHGKEVTIIDMIKEQDIAADSSFVGRVALIDLLRKHNVRFITEVVLEAINDQGAVVSNKSSEKMTIAADTIVLSLGVTPRQKTVDQLRGAANETYIIGDCSKPRNVMAAIHSAFVVAAEI